MHRLIRYARANAIACVALFVALGGTGYAAVSLPRNSVGTNQLRNGAVTPKKLAASGFAGQVMFTAQMNGFGRVLSSSPRGATTYGWQSNPADVPDGGLITWHRRIPKGCFSVTNTTGLPTDAGPAYASSETLPQSAKLAYVRVFMSSPLDVQVAVICPTP